jgi:hypothetical protein
MALTEDNSRGWSDALANRWLLVKDGDNSLVKAPGQAVLARIAAGDDAVRAALCAGRDLSAAQRRHADAVPPRRAAAAAGLSGDPDRDAADRRGAERLVVEGATLVFRRRRCRALDRPPRPARRSHPPARRDAPAITARAGRAGRHDLRGQPLRPAPRATSVAADSLLSPATVVSGDTALDVFGRPTAPLVELPLEKRVPGRRLRSGTRWRTLAGAARRGGAARRTLDAHRISAEPALKLSLRLLNGAGERRRAERRARRPTACGSACSLPPDAPPATYALAAVLYDPATGVTDRLTRDGESARGVGGDRGGRVAQRMTNPSTHGDLLASPAPFAWLVLPLLALSRRLARASRWR